MDIVEHCGVPRFLFTDFPLGNPCGVPFDREMQKAIVGSAIDLFDTAKEPRVTVRSAFRFSADEGWRASFLAVTEERRAELAAAGASRRAILAEKKLAEKKQDRKT